MSDVPQLSIIIVNHRSRAVLGDCLNAIAACGSRLSMEIIVVDNPPEVDGGDSTNGTGLTVLRVPSPRRLGFAAACNLGVRHAGGEYLLFVNPDLRPEPSAIDSLHAVLTERPRAGIAAGRLVGPDGHFQPSCRRFPTLKNMLFSRGSVFHRLTGIGRGTYTLPDYDEITEVDSAAAAMMMVPRERFEEMGGFDERFFMYLEDTDFCRRMADSRYCVYFVPGAVGRHDWGHSTGHYRFRRIIWHHSSVWRYFRKHRRSLPVMIVLWPLLAVNCGLSLVGELFRLKS